MAKVFISYKRDVQPDEPLATEIFRRLSELHEVFIDQTILIGEAWAQRIKQEIDSSDVLLLLLSERSVESAMVVEEVRIAEAAQRNRGRPRILPVRVAFALALPYELGAMLNRIQYARWNGPEDTSRLIDGIVRALSGSAAGLEAPSESPATPLPSEVPLAAANPRAPLDAPEGTMSPLSSFYVQRHGDSIAEEEQEHEGFTLTVKGPRQMGKSSLLARLIHRARTRGGRIAFIDFQRFGREVFSNPEALFRQLCVLIEDELGLDSQLDGHWRAGITPPSNATRFMERRVMRAMGDSGLVLAIDEADGLLDSAARADLFGMLRSWHNQRANDPLWRKFSLVMAISTEPAMLIESLSQSPFNVGAAVELEDFTIAETAQMNVMHGSPLLPAQVQALQGLVGGHPYLSRKALYGLCKHRYSFEDMLRDADSESGPFGDHLRAQLTRVHQREGLPAMLAGALQTGRCADDDGRHRLIAGGLLREDGRHLVARNRLYNDYFRRVLLG